MRLSNAVLLSIVRANRRLLPRWDELVNSAQDPSPPDRAILYEILGAIPEPRRTSVLLKWFNRTYGKSAIALALDALPRFPSALLTGAVLDRLAPAGLPADDVVRALEKIGKSHDVVGDALAAHETTKKRLAAKAAKRPPVATIALSLGSDVWPRSVKDLNPKQRKQLEELGRGYDGKRMPAAARFGSGDDAHASSLRIRALLDARGKVVYEAFTWLADDGCVFVAGTTRSVAELVQHGVECDDVALERALVTAFAGRPKKKR